MVRIAFIGAGNMAEQHARAFAALPDVQLAGVWSRTPANAQAFAARHDMPAFATIEALHRVTGADLAVIAVKEPATLEAAVAAGRLDWALMFEKPAGHTVALAEDVKAAAEQNGRTARLALNRRFYDASRQVRAALADDQGPRFVQVLDQQSFAGARAVGHSEDVVQNFMYANSIHLVDYLRQFGRGEIAKVRVDSPWRGEATFVQGATIQFSSGDVGRYDSLWNGPGPWACIVSTPAARFEMRPLEGLSCQKAGSRQVEMLSIDPVDTQFKAGFLRQAEEMLKAVRGEANAMPTLADGLATMRLIEAIYAGAN